MNVLLRKNDKGSISLIMTEGRQRCLMCLNSFNDVLDVNKQLTEEILRVSKEISKNRI